MNQRSKSAVAANPRLRKINSGFSKHTASNGVGTQNGSAFDLTHVKFSTPAKPSRDSEIVHQFTVLSRYLNNGPKKEDFLAANEREIVEKFLQLEEMVQQKVYNQLKHEFLSP